MEMHGPSKDVFKMKRMINFTLNKPFEKVVFDWFDSQRKTGRTIKGCEIQEVAMRVNQEMGGPANFKASNGWLASFKRRHGIRQLSLQDTNLDAVDMEAVSSFCEEFNQIVKELECTPDNMYNVVKSGLQWNALPQNIANASTTTVLKDRVPLILCVNSTGSVKFPVMVVGRSKNPRSFRDLAIPVHYVCHGNGYPSDLIYEEWFRDVFMPVIEKRRENPENTGNIVVVVDIDPTAAMLKLVEGKDVKVVNFKSRVNTLIEPLNQGLLDQFKRCYRDSFLKEMVYVKDGLEYAVERRWTMMECCFAIASAWDSITEERIQVAWRKLLQLDSLDDADNEMAFYSCGVEAENQSE